MTTPFHKKILLLVFLLFSMDVIFSQEEAKLKSIESTAFKYRYDQDLLSKEFHKERREALRKLMPDSSVAVFFANPVRNRSNDVDYEYHQDPNFYYLTGLTEPDAILLIFKEAQDFDSLKTKELIFIQERNLRKEIWSGRRLGKEGVSLLLGLDAAFINKDFADTAIDFSKFNQTLFIPPYEDIRDDRQDKGDLYSLIKYFNNKSSNLGDKLDKRKLYDLMAGLREIKQKEELALMRKAIEITCQAQKELMKALDPGMTEYQSEAIIEYFFKKNGAEYPGFPSILGGGENSCILHYTSNRKPLYNKDLLVVDIGAEYHGYTADVTRTLPVNGKYTEEQKIIYNIVLEAQTAGIKACKSGNGFREPHKETTRIIQSRLMELGIIKNPTEAGTYFMHGTSHYLGLDVHDAGLFGNLTPGNVITVEPGIYIAEGSDCDPKWWNIGIRIEDDILITEGDPENLSVSAPRTIEEIEKLMKEQSPFNVIK